jgi:putative endonuclease
MCARNRQHLGKSGEDLACLELERRGYAILDRRYRTRFGELDIVARQNGTVVFIEVKTRGSARFGHGLEAVTWHKRRKIVLMAGEYMLWHGLGSAPCRFDVVAIVWEGSRPHLEVVADAFEAAGF